MSFADIPDQRVAPSGGLGFSYWWESALLGMRPMLSMCQSIPGHQLTFEERWEGASQHQVQKVSRNQRTD